MQRNRLNAVLISDREQETIKEAAVVLESQSTLTLLEREPHLRKWAETVATVLADISDPTRLLNRDYRTN